MTRNIVLITYDSLRADHCGFMGYDRETTPALDAMASDGLVFENAIASGVPTIASMTAVMTGEHSLASPEIGFNTEQREQVTSRRTIAEVLSNAGYSTGALSPNPPASSYFGFDSGFDWFEDFLAEDTGVVERAWNRVFRNSIEGGGLSTYLRLFKNVVTKDEILRPWSDFYDQIMAWRERVEEPYFLWVLLLEPHHPWMPPSETQRWSSRSDKYRAFQQYYEMFTNGWEPDFDDETHDRLVNLYDDSIRYGDQFLDRLQSDLAADDPVFVVHADHGEEFGEHGRYGHQPYLTEELIHVPLVVGNLGRDERVSDPVGLRQLAPTIADLADASQSFRAPSMLDDSGRPWVTSKVFAEGHRRAAVRTRSGKYLKDGDREALYDLGADPGEQDNRVEESPEGRDAFSDALTRHVQMETETRAIRAAVEEVSDT
ncbi:sulfatase [Halococcoides cellulosivorans]|nr:sulfatase [Halococcoides cellulosivorans]